MTEQEKREKVINGLECCLGDTRADLPNLCTICPYAHGSYATQTCGKKLREDALALLKAQEPMAMADTELEAIRKAPLILKPNVDAVPVVRCRDCTYYDSEPGGDIMMCYNGLGWTEQNDFCSKGERRDGE